MCSVTVSADPELPIINLDIPTPPTSPCVWLKATRLSPHRLSVCRQPRRSAPAHALAGVDDVLTKCYDFGARMFTLYESSAVTGRMLVFFLSNVWYSTRVAVSGLLVTGRAGAGKTSVVQATSKALQWDSRVQACRFHAHATGPPLKHACSHTLCGPLPLHRKPYPDVAHAVSVLARQGNVASSQCPHIR